ncbi:MAG TPA: hypothetical protein VFT98_22180 [Myxococcota bacterium]|nr:hypothetical protein [Myxococcota bacterium]
MTHDPFKYAKLERERRFLVSPTELPGLGEEFVRFEDLYLTGTRLRLRIASEHPGGAVLYRLTQKLQQPEATTRRITTQYLSAPEHAVFAALPGARLVKRRHRVLDDGLDWGVDVFEGALAGLVLAEREFDSDDALRAAAPPSFAACEVTDDVAFTGGALATTPASETLARAQRLLERAPKSD